MSLKVLLRCSDEEFEKLLAMTDMEGVLDIISELQTEMDKEQRKFDELSVALSRFTDPSSAEYKRFSMELVKSQNMLALLVSRNMHCFHVSNEPEEEPEVEVDKDFSLVVHQSDNIHRKHRVDNSSVTNTKREEPSNKLTQRAANVNTNIDDASIHTRTSAKTLPHIPSNSLTDTVDSAATQPTTSTKLAQSTATLSVITPKQSKQEIKPKRILKVKTTNLSDGKSSTSNSVSSSSATSNSERKTLSPDSPVKILPHGKQLVCPKVKVSAQKVNISTSEPSFCGLNRSKSRTMLKLNTRSLSPTDVDVVPSPNTSELYSPDSNSVNRISSTILSPRSDISNLATPRSLVSSPRIPVSSILDLDMPETSIDEDNLWEERVTPGGGETVSDKISCTTDESGFTSASSDSDITLIAPDIVYDYHSEDEEKLEERVSIKAWDPSKLLLELYATELAKEPSTNVSDVINMEGYLERLPVGKDKDTLLKTWRRAYCKAIDGIIYFYDKKNSTKSQSYMSLMGGILEELSNTLIGIDDMRGHYLMVRCPSEVEHSKWKDSFYTQIKCSPHSTYIRPGLTSKASSHTPKVVIIDLGSTSTRAGILGGTPTYPQLFFPSVTSTNNKGQTVFGEEAYAPENRVYGLHRPVASCKDIDTYRINVQVLPDLFHKIFTDLEVDAQDFMVLLSTPHNFSLRLKEEVINILINRIKVAGVSMVNQSLLTPYIYNATSGIVVDIGERIEIVAITDGYLIDGGLNRQSFGGAHITDILNTYLVEYRLFTPVEQLLSRLVKEKACFVSQDYGDDLLRYMCNDRECEADVDLSSFDLPPSFHVRNISVDTARFKAPEGLLKTELLGADSPTLPKLIAEAVQKCPMDVRREMWQSIYLSGGTTLIEGFPERLQKELGKIVPSSINVQVHASPHRYHAAYIGACMLAKLPNFRESCISREEWTTVGSASLNKWKKYFQG